MDKKGSSMVFDVVGLHGLNYDLSAAVQRLPQHDEKVPARLLSSQPGGPVGNFACAASKLGLRVAVHTRLGDDNFSERILQEFNAYRVDTHWIHQEPGSTADLAVILVDPSGERAIIVMEPAPVPSELMETILPDLITQTGCFFLTLHSFMKLRSCLDKARSKGIQVMMDIEDTPQVGQTPLSEILNNCDIASFNRSGFLAYTGKEADPALLDALLAEHQVHTIVVTQGSQGVMGVAIGEQPVHIPGIKVDVKDTTGAGDTFNAAFLTARLKGLRLQAALNFANAAAALSVTSFGAKGSLPAWDEVEAFLGLKDKLF